MFCLSWQCCATPQILDMLIMKNDTFFFYKSPLANTVHLIERDSNFIKNRILTTANTRGYVATWEIIGDQMYLSKINNLGYGKIEADLQIIFDTQDPNKRIKASWINDEMVVRCNKVMRGYSIGLSNVYEQEYILNIKNGNLISVKKLNNTFAKHPNDNSSLLNKYIIDKLPKKLIKKIVKNNSKYEFYAHVTFDSNKRIKSIACTKTEFETAEIEKIIAKFDDWKFVYKKGKLMNEYVVKIQINSRKFKKKRTCW